MAADHTFYQALYRRVLFLLAPLFHWFIFLLLFLVFFSLLVYVLALFFISVYCVFTPQSFMHHCGKSFF